MDKGMKVFLSSTYIDLINHRKLAAEALERLKLEVGRMEVFGARPDEPSKACLNEVEDCELFIGIYAHRYGHIPKGGRVSITEAELRCAQDNGKAIFCFVIDDNYPWPPKFIDDDPGKVKLNILKTMIRERFTIDTFGTPEDLAYKIASSIGRYITKSNSLIIKSNSFKARNPFLLRLRKCMNLSELLERALIEFAKITLTDYNQILLVCSTSYANQLVTVADAIPLHKKRFRNPTLFGLLGLALFNGRIINARDIRDWPEYIEWDPATKSELVVPIRTKDSISGVLNSESGELNHFDDKKCNSAELIASALAILLPEFGWTKNRKAKDAPWIKIIPNV
jgi:hypothetical protein